MKKIITAVCALSVVLSLCGCSKSESNDSSETSSKPEASVVTEEQTIEKEEISSATVKIAELPTSSSTKIPKAKINDKRIPKSNVSEIIRISSANTGIELTVPGSLNIYNGEEKSAGNMIIPEFIPTAAEPVLVSDANGNNINFFAAAAISDEEFKSLEQADVENVFLSGTEGVFESVEVIRYERATYGGYNGIRMDVRSVLSGVEMTQTIIMVNAVKENTAKGYAYTITYTDVTGNMQEAFEESIKTIGFDGITNMYLQYNTPEECAEGQKNGEYKKYDRDAAVKNHLEKKGLDRDTIDKIMDVREQAAEDAENNTRTTLSYEEMREKYLGE